MLSKEDAILLTLMGLAQHYKAKYCKPSQKKILDLCFRIHGVKMSRRTLNRLLRLLEESKTIERIRRLSKRHFDNGKFVESVPEINCASPSQRNPEDGRFKTTLYKFTGKCFNRMFLLARKLGNLFKFYRWPEWARRKYQSEKAKAAQPVNRVPKLAHYNPIQGVSVTNSSPDGVVTILKGLRVIRLKPSEAIL